MGFNYIMIALYTEDQLVAAYQTYVRFHAVHDLDAVPFETYREMFEYQYLAMSSPEEIFDGGGETKH
jgi:hypothetical protein